MSDDRQDALTEVIKDVSAKLNQLASASHDEIVWRTNTDNSIRDITKSQAKIIEEVSGDAHTPGLKTRVMMQENRIDGMCDQLAQLKLIHARQDTQDKRTSEIEVSTADNTKTLNNVRKLSWLIIAAIVAGGGTVLATLWSK